MVGKGGNNVSGYDTITNNNFDFIFEQKHNGLFFNHRDSVTTARFFTKL
jgi:hypothetical protein